MPLRMTAVSLLAIALAACGGNSDDETPAPAETPEVAPEAAEADGMEMEVAGPSLAEIIAMPERGDAAARDVYRHPVETLEFFGIAPGMTVVEVWPGGGWYADILVPYVTKNGGIYIAAHNDPTTNERAAQRVEAFKEKYGVTEDGPVRLTALSPNTSVAPAGSADMVLTFRNAHNWVMGGYAEGAFSDFYAALKPGGVLGVVDHRLPEEYDDELQKSSGYLKQSAVIAMAEAAGFVLDAESEINANEMDTADHPYGVWTLPPVSRTPREGEDAPEGFDAEKYLAIGESDRMTLRFVKPAE